MDFEIELIEFLQAGRTEFWDIFFQTVTQAGSVLGFVGFFLFLLRFDRKLCLTFSISYGYELLIVSAVKEAVARVRPYNAVSSIVCIGGFESEFSFPSGHTALATTIAIFMAYFLWKRCKTTRGKVWSVICCALYVCIIGISRMYLGVHYLTDVLGGALFGIVFAVVGILVMNWLLKKGQRKVKNETET